MVENSKSLIAETLSTNMFLVIRLGNLPFFLTSLGRKYFSVLLQIHITNNSFDLLTLYFIFNGIQIDCHMYQRYLSCA